jgi:hypothetical protein
MSDEPFLLEWQIDQELERSEQQRKGVYDASVFGSSVGYVTTILIGPSAFFGLFQTVPQC